MSCLQINFPSVTICNLNIIHCGHLRRLISETDCNLSSNCQASIARYELNQDTLIWLNRLGFATGCITDGDFSNSTKQPSLGSIGTNVKNLFTILPNVTRIAIGHQFEDMFKMCKFKKNLSCINRSIFHLVNTNTHGNCFVFNHIKNRLDEWAGTRPSSITGEAYGIHIKKATR